MDETICNNESALLNHVRVLRISGEYYLALGETEKAKELALRAREKEKEREAESDKLLINGDDGKHESRKSHPDDCTQRDELQIFSELHDEFKDESITNHSDKATKILEPEDMKNNSVKTNSENTLERNIQQSDLRQSQPCEDTTSNAESKQENSMPVQSNISQSETKEEGKTHSDKAMDIEQDYTDLQSHQKECNPKEEVDEELPESLLLSFLLYRIYLALNDEPHGIRFYFISIFFMVIDY